MPPLLSQAPSPSGSIPPPLLSQLSALHLHSLTLQGSGIITDWYLSYWTNVPYDERSDGKYLGAYAAVVGVFVLSAFARTRFFMSRCNKVLIPA